MDKRSSAARDNAIPAEARGRLRVWREMAEKRYKRFEQICEGRETAKAVADFCLKRGLGRQRAWPALQRVFHDVAYPESLGDAGKLPFAVWSVIRPRDAVLVRVPGRDLTPEEQQDSVAICYAITARHNDGGVAIESALWTGEATMHAVGRLLQRDRSADVDQVMIEFHRNLLSASTDFVKANVHASMVIPAGRGAFQGNFRMAEGIESGQLCLVYRASTWINDDLLRPAQVAAAEALAAEPGRETLADYWMDPLRLAERPARKAAPKTDASTGGRDCDRQRPT
jgi:hypothetical protein